MSRGGDYRGSGRGRRTITSSMEMDFGGAGDVEESLTSFWPPHEPEPVIPPNFFEVRVPDQEQLEEGRNFETDEKQLLQVVPDVDPDPENINISKTGGEKVEDPEDSRVPENKLHPLLLHNVLKDIFKYFDQSELKIAREVHPIWNEEACKGLSKSYTVTFVDEKSVKNYMKAFDPESNNFPHSRYQFYNVHLTPNNRTLQRFFMSFGNRVETLILQLKEIPESGLYPILENWTPNLIHLWLRTLPSYKEKLVEEDVSVIRSRAIAEANRQAWADAMNLRIGEDPNEDNVEFRDRDPGRNMQFRMNVMRGRVRNRIGFGGRRDAPLYDIEFDDEIETANYDPEDSINEGSGEIRKRPTPPPNPPVDTSNLIFPSIRHITIGTWTRPGFTTTPPAPAAGVPPLQNQHLLNQRFNGQGRAGLDDFPIPGHPLFSSYSGTLVKLLKTLPNLSVVSISKLDEPYGSRIPSFTKFLLGSLQAAGPFHRICRLNFPIHVWTNNSEIEELYRIPINFLNELHLSIDTKEVDSPVVFQLLSDIGEHLQKLDLSFDPSYPFGNSSEIKFPVQKLTRLKNLKLTRFKWRLLFLGRLPSLTSLTLHDTNLESTFPINFQSVHKNLTSLVISNSVVEGSRNLEAKLDDSEIAARITRVFPNLRVFHCPGASDDTLRLIYSDLPWIEELVIENGEFTDYGVSGVKLEICKDFQEQYTFYDVNADEFRCDLFVGNLMSLKKLVLSSKHMTDLAVNFGILRCSNLKTLVLKSPNITDFAMEIITKKMGNFLCSFNVNGCPNVTAAGRFIAKETYVGRNFLVPENVVNEKLEKFERAKRLHKAYDTFQRGMKQKGTQVRINEAIGVPGYQYRQDIPFGQGMARVDPFFHPPPVIPFIGDGDGFVMEDVDEEPEPEFVLAPQGADPIDGLDFVEDDVEEEVIDQFQEDGIFDLGFPPPPLVGEQEDQNNQ